MPRIERTVSILDDIAEKIQSLLTDEESMRQIRELAAMFSGGEDFSADGNAGAAASGEFSGVSSEQEQEGFDGFGIDPLILMQLIGAATASDKNCDLLKALRPHLSQEKQQKLDRAVKLLKLYNVFVTMRESGMLNDLEKML